MTKGNSGANAASMIRLLAFLFLLVMLVLSASAQAPSSPAITLIDPAQTEDNQVTLGVRLTGVDPRRLSAFTAANFRVDEPFTGLTVAAEPRLPMTLGVVVNLSVGSELDLIQRTLRAYFDRYYRDGDRVTFTILTGRTPVEAAPEAREEIAALIDGLTRAPGYFNVAEVLPDVARQLTEAQAEDPERTVQALLVTSFINNATEAQSAEAFVEAGIPLHVVQAHRFRQSFTGILRQMAASTGGIFVNNQEGALVTDVAPTPVGALKVLYDALDSSRTVFTVSFRSTSRALDTEPTIILSVQTSAEQTAVLSFSYQRSFDPPVVEFANPSITAARRPSRNDEGGVNFDVAGQDIAVYVRFPDAVPREIVSLELQVTDVTRDVVVQSHLEVDPQVEGDGAYRVRWELDEFSHPGSITPVLISVAVTDELGLTGCAEQQASVTVAALPPLPTSTPLPPTATFTPLPPTPTAVSTQVASSAAEAIASTRGSTVQGSTNDMTTLLAVITTTFAGIIAALLLRLRRIRRRFAIESERIVIAPHVDQPTPLPGPDPEPEAEPQQLVGRLFTKRGLPPQEIPINTREFVIGRKAGEGIHFAIDQPFISPRHCIIVVRNGRFLIRDLASKNGTFVNGERLHPDREVVVPVGSEIEITRSIVFELWDPNTAVEIDYHMDDTRTERLSTRISTTADSVSFPSALGIRAATEDDDGEIGEDYSPV